MKLNKNMKIACICRGGQVRSVCARYILNDMFGFRKVLAAGWEKNDPDTIKMLCHWADAVLIVGSATKWLNNNSIPPEFKHKYVLLDIGEDVWHHYNNKELVKILGNLLEKMI